MDAVLLVLLVAGVLKPLLSLLLPPLDWLAVSPSLLTDSPDYGGTLILSRRRKNGSDAEAAATRLGRLALRGSIDLTRKYARRLMPWLVVFENGRGAQIKTAVRKRGGSAGNCISRCKITDAASAAPWFEMLAYYLADSKAHLDRGAKTNLAKPYQHLEWPVFTDISRTCIRALATFFADGVSYQQRYGPCHIS